MIAEFLATLTLEELVALKDLIDELKGWVPGGLFLLWIFRGGSDDDYY